jgi:hypothetical protein
VTDSVASLGFSVDSSVLQQAGQSLAGLSSQAQAFARSLDQLAAAGEPMGLVLDGIQRSGAASGQVMAELAQRYAATGQAAEQAGRAQTAGAQAQAAAAQGIAQAQGAAASAAGRTTDAFGRLNTAAAEVAAGSARLNASFAQFEPLAAQQQRIVQALAAGYIDAATAARAWVLAQEGAARQGGRTAQQPGTGSGATGSRGGGATRELQNASYQITDFVVEVSNGIDPVRALGQQLPQLLSGFGAVGAVAGLAAAGVAALVPVIGSLVGVHGDAAKAAEDQTKSTDGLLKSLDATREGAGSLAASITGLSSAQKSLVGASLEADLHAQSAAFDEAAKKAADYVKGLGQGARVSTVLSSMLGQGEFSTGPSEQDAERFRAVSAAAQELQNRIQGLQSGAGTFDQVAEAIRRMGDAQREAGGEASSGAAQWDKVTASQTGAARAAAAGRVEIEQQIDKLAPLAAAEEAARQALLLQTAQVHEFLAAMGQGGAITAFDEQILNQAEVAKTATAAIRELNAAHKAVVAGEVADRIRASGIPNADREADDYLTRELAKGPAEQFQRGQQTRQAEATIVYKGDTSEAQKALDLLKQAGTNVGETFEQNAERLRALGQQLGTPYPVVQAAIEKARAEADRLIASQHQQAVAQQLIVAGLSPEKAQQQSSAIAQGNAGLQGRAKLSADLADAERARDALAAKGPEFERDRATAAQRVAQIQEQIGQLDSRQAETARQKADAAAKHVEQLARQRDQLLAQEGPEAKLLAAEQDRARALKDGVLKSPAEVQQSLQGSYRTFASDVAQQAGRQAGGLPERERIQAQINAEREAENAHGEARVAIDEEINRLTGERQRLLDHENEQIDKLLAGDQKRLAAQRLQNQRLIPGAGGIADRVSDAADQAGSQFPDLAAEQRRANPAAQAQREADRQLAENLARGNEVLRARKEAVEALNDPYQRLAEQQAKLDNEVKAGLITEDQYTQALRRLQVQADQAARQQRIQDLLDTGEQGSGVSTGGQVASGAQAAALQYAEQYGNVAKETAGFLDQMGQTGVDAFAQLATGAKVNLAEIGTSLEQLAVKMFLQIALAKALQAAFGGTPSAGAGYAAPTTSEGAFAATGGTGAAYGFHGGGEVGSGGGGPIIVDPELFRGAPRYHGGGDIGPDERRAVLQTGERVLSRQEARAYAGGPSGPPPINFKVVNNAGAAVGAPQVRQNGDGSIDIMMQLERAQAGNITGGKMDKAASTRWGVDRRLV